MKRIFCIATVLGTASLASAAMYISETQAIVQSGLAGLKFEKVEPKRGLIGAPSQFKITPATIQYLGSLMKQGKQITVAADGRIEVITGNKESAEAGKKVAE